MLSVTTKSQDAGRPVLAPVWVTVIVWGDSPVPVTVMVPVRGDVSVFSVQVTCTVALLVPESTDNCIQLRDSEIIQSTFEVIVRAAVLPAARKDREVGETLSAGVVPACVTAMVWVATPVPEMVMFAVRALVLVLGLHTTLIVPALDPEAGLRLNQEALSVTVQLVLEVIPRV